MVDNVQLITFTIDGTEYQAEEGMTWEEWMASDYDTVGAILSDDPSSDFMLIEIWGEYLYKDGSFVNPNEEIDETISYKVLT